MNGWKEDRDQDKSGFTAPSSRTTQRTRTTQPSFYQTSDSKTPIRSENKNKKENAKEHIELKSALGNSFFEMKFFISISLQHDVTYDLLCWI